MIPMLPGQPEPDYADWLENLPEVVLRLDGDLRVNYLNRAWTARLGYPRQECLGRPLGEYVDAEGLQQLVNMVFCATRENALHTQEIPVRHTDGRPLAFEWSIRWLADATLLATLRYTEEQKQYARRLRESDAQAKKLALVASRTHNAVIIADAHGITEWVNEAFTRISGYAPEEVIGYKPGELLQGPGTDPETVRQISDCLREGRGCVREILNYRKNGEPYWIELEIQPIHDELGRVAQYIAIEQEVTERKAAEEAARQSEARQAAIMDAALDCILTIDTQGRLLEFNPAAERTFGYRREEVLGYEFASLIIAPSHVGAHHEGFERHLRTGVSHILGRRLRNLPARRKDGSTFPAELTVVPMEVNGEKAFTAFLRDITWEVQAEEQERQTAEELRLARDAAEAANRAKSDFLANISHEVRTPMSAVIGYADMLLDPGLERSTRDSTVEAIRRNGKHLLQIINDVLDLSKIEAERLEIVSARMPLWGLVSESLSVARVPAREKGLTLEAIPVGALPRMITTDPTRFRQILDNLLSNAVKFTQVGRVRLYLRLLKGGDEPARLVLEVEDEGIGIRPDQVERLFQPFMQVDTSATRRFGGTGLGLSISRRLARALGGEIVVESQPGQGSRFVVTLPLLPEDLNDLVVGSEIIQSSPEQVSDQVPPEGASPVGRVLLAEDSVDNQRIITYYLERAGMRVEVAENGMVAVRKTLAGAFDIVLMDMQMPVLDGYSATRELRSAGYQGPVVALTAHAMIGDEDRCLKAGCTAYLSKPVDPKVLVRTLTRLVRGGSGASGHSQFGAAPSSAATPASTPVHTPVPEALRELFDGFRQSLPDQLARIRDALQRQDLAGLGVLAHRLRGAAAMYQLPEVSRAAGQVEECVRKPGAAQGLEGALGDLEAAVRSATGGGK